ncbi:hypothetical protein GO608_006270 [Aromatoleum buckelii]|nr:hypothetical protein [Aromatoleum buckelii]
MLVSFAGVEDAALPSAVACGDGGRKCRGVLIGPRLDREKRSPCDRSERGVSSQAGITAIVLRALPGSAAVVLAALGHALFTLSPGMGVMIAYGSYLARDINLIRAAGTVAIANTTLDRGMSTSGILSRKLSVNDENASRCWAAAQPATDARLVAL